MSNKINSLIKELLAENVDAYIIPTFDEYQSEYTADYAKRLEYITNFTGSYAVAIIFKNRLLSKLAHDKEVQGAYGAQNRNVFNIHEDSSTGATQQLLSGVEFQKKSNNQNLFYTDGRYLLQAEKEIDSSFKVLSISELKNLEVKDIIFGYDPMLFTEYQLKIFGKNNLQPINSNLVDKIWKDKPSRPSSKVYNYPTKYSGQSAEEKLLLIKDKVEEGAALIINSSDSICWLLNIRASDVLYNPVLLGYLIYFKEQVFLFVEKSRIKNLQKILPYNILDQEQIWTWIKDNLKDKKVLVDKTKIPVRFLNEIPGETKHMEDPTVILKACKNNIEIKHAEKGHKYDAISLCEFFAWLELEVKSKHHNIDEITIEEKLLEFRQKNPHFIFPSFASICGFKENAAIIHYHASPLTNKKIQGDGLLLIDSGGQYKGCTTDITRTILIGKATKEFKLRYTQVLKGHIALATLIFPPNINGSNLDVLARQFLWADKVDYAHGTGHGVGSFLCVHEGPQRISLNSQVTLKEGMILSNEPGFYKQNHFGIRIENLMYVKRNENYLQFENLTIVPYEEELINFEMLNKEEIEYLKKYYKRIHTQIHKDLSHKAQKWLEKKMQIPPV